MVRGFYSAAAGVLTQQKAINVISNNIANATAAGYKRQSTIETSFGDHMVSRLSTMANVTDKNIGTGSFMTANIEEYTDFSQGSLENTGRSVDMAIRGEGFFLVESKSYGEVLTRNGQFEMDQDGNLILPGVGKVLNENKREIKLEGSNFAVSAAGVISEDGGETGTLYIAAANEDSALIKVGDGSYQSSNGYQKAKNEAYSIIQGAIEKSNSNMANEMSKIISGQSHFQSCAQILKIYDSINELTVNRIGRID